jgi:hypothetical protein
LDRTAIYYQNSNRKGGLKSAVLTRWHEFHEPATATVNYVDYIEYMNANRSQGQGTRPYSSSGCGSERG